MGLLLKPLMVMPLRIGEAITCTVLQRNTKAVTRKGHLRLMDEPALKEIPKAQKELVALWTKHCRKLETEIEQLKEELRKYRGY
jgi:hypothetical protein